MRVPFIERCFILDGSQAKVTGTLSAVTAEGSTLDATCEFSLEPRSAQPAILFEAARTGDLTAAGRKAIATIHDVTGPAARGVVIERLAPLGLVPESLLIGPFSPRADAGGASASSGPLEALKAAYAGPSRRVLLIGIDSADWSIIDPMIDRGELPALRSLKARGAWGVLKSMSPTLSPLLWTSIATGKTPDQHGIVDFLSQDPGSGKMIPITSRSRKARALWTILTELGVPSLTVGWWATWPAERVVGEMITDRVSYSLMETQARAASSGTTFPAALAERVTPLTVPPDRVTLSEARRIIDISEEEFARARSSLAKADSWRDPAAHLLRILAATRTYHQIALDRLRSGQPPLALVYYEGLDEVNHRFAAYQPPAMKWADPAKTASYARAVESFYKLQDGLVGDLVKAVDPNTVIIIVSDHGFADGDRRPTDVPPDIEGKPGRWHSLDGVIIAAGPIARSGRMARDPSIIDITPTILALLSLPRALDMQGRAVPEIVRQDAVPNPPVGELATYERPTLNPGNEVAPAPSETDDEMMRKLVALGYIRGPDEAPHDGDGVVGPPGTITGHVNAGNALIANGKYADAEPEYRAALALAPRFLPARLGLAQCLIATGRQRDGWEELASALTAGNDLDETTYLKVAGFYRRRGHAVEGAQLFDRLPRRAGLEAARLTALGILLEASGDTTGARRALESALREDTAFTGALRAIYRLLTDRGAIADLTPILENARRSRPDGVVASNLLALTWERAGRRVDAVHLLEGILHASPRDLETLTNLAGMRLRGGDAAGAVSILRRARDVNPSSLRVIANLIIALGRSKDLGGAREVFREAGVDAERSQVLNAMAYATYVNGETAEARALVMRSLERDPEQPGAKSLLATIDGASASGGPTPSSGKGPGL